MFRPDSPSSGTPRMWEISTSLKMCRSKGPLSVASLQNDYRILLTLTTTVSAVKHSQFTLQYPGLSRQNISEISISKTTAAWFLTVEQPQILHSLTRLWECQGQTGKQYKKWKWFDKFHLNNSFGMLKLSFAQRVNRVCVCVADKVSKKTCNLNIMQEATMNIVGMEGPWYVESLCTGTGTFFTAVVATVRLC
jgi:hypothetical protein